MIRKVAGECIRAWMTLDLYRKRPGGTGHEKHDEADATTQR